METANRAQGFVGGRAEDLLWFVGGAALSIAAGALVLAVPSLLAPLFWLWLLLVDGPHLVATWSRTYLDPAERRRRGPLLGYSLLWLLPGPLAVLAARASGSRAPWDAFLLFAVLWAFHHAVRQNYGILSIYQRHASATPRARRLDSLFLYFFFWALFAGFAVLHPDGRITLGLAPGLSPAELLAAKSGLALFFSLSLLYAVELTLRGRRGEPLRPVLIALLPPVAVIAFVYFVVGPREPLLPRCTSAEQLFLTMGLAGGVLHGLQYLGLVFIANRRRAETSGAGLFGTLARAPLRAWLLFVAISIGYVALNAARGIGPGYQPFPIEGDTARLFIALYWGLFFHHYYLDQKIWRPGADAALRKELGLEPA